MDEIKKVFDEIGPKQVVSRLEEDKDDKYKGNYHKYNSEMFEIQKISYMQDQNQPKEYKGDFDNYIKLTRETNVFTGDIESNALRNILAIFENITGIEQPIIRINESVANSARRSELSTAAGSSTKTEEDDVNLYGSTIDIKEFRDADKLALRESHNAVILLFLGNHYW
jgi:hypothetical protein